MPATFPTDSDVSTFLAALGYTFVVRTDAASRARDTFIDDTGRAPWFAASETRTFDSCEGRLLYLRGSCLEATDVRVDGVSIDSSLWSLQTPSTIRFALDIPPSKPHIIEVDGTWGYAPAGANAVPDDVYDAVLVRAAADAILEMSSGHSSGDITGPIKGVRHGDVSYEYAVEPGSGGIVAIVSPLLSRYERAVKKYTVLVGVS